MNPILDIASFTGRKNFGSLLNTLGFHGHAVEVGTHRGVFAESFLSKWNEGILHCVDPWQPYDEGDPASLGDRAEDERICRIRLQPYSGRVVIHKGYSVDVARKFEDYSLDFVYIDAKHRIADVRQDMGSWWSKIRDGGILAGHDFICPTENLGGWGRFVQRAVLKFAMKRGLTVFMVEDSPGPWSYYIVK